MYCIMEKKRQEKKIIIPLDVEDEIAPYTHTHNAQIKWIWINKSWKQQTNNGFEFIQKISFAGILSNDDYEIVFFSGQIFIQ